jgi:hypothetical protein
VAASTLESVQRALDALETRGAQAFDAASCECVRTLIARAAAFDGGASELLAKRAGAHLERLSQRFEAARVLTETRLVAAEAAYGSLPEQRAALERGDLTTVRRRLRKLAVAPLVRSQSVGLERDRLRRVKEYELALADLVTAFALAQATDSVPAHAGPYNPLRVASDLIARMRVASPLYLTSQLQRLEELASMLALPELPAPPAPKPQPKPQAKARPKPGARRAQPATATVSARGRTTRKR